VTKLLLYRLLQLPLILGIVYVATFLLVWVAPGSPFEGERNLAPEVKAALQERFNAESAWSFLTYYPWRILTAFDFGPSFANPQVSVGEMIWQRMPVSAAIGALAMAIAVVVGTVVGTLAAVKRGGVLDWVSLTFTLIGISLPGFVLAALLLIVFGSVMFNLSMQYPSVMGLVVSPGFGETWLQLALPGLALSLAPMAYITRLTRVSMLDVLGADYVRTARAKGCSKPVVVFKHCLRNAFLPVFSYLGPATAATLTGSFVVETVFNSKGMGELFVMSVTNRDQTLILGVVMVYSTLLMTLNLIVDVGYALVDPRIDLTAKG
jgi:oligopeptide transport system permease protein